MSKLTTITVPTQFHEITRDGVSVLPDADSEVLVYDGVLDDTVKASLDYEQPNARMVWIDQTTGDPLPDPQFWADVPFPGEAKPSPMPLPVKGEVVPDGQLIALLQSHGKYDIIAYISDHGVPDRTFSCDGCSLFTDIWHGYDRFPACLWHDIRYWCGIPGDYLARLLADLELAKDVAIITGDTALARKMFIGVGVGGVENTRTSFRWGYGGLGVAEEIKA